MGSGRGHVCHGKLDRPKVPRLVRWALALLTGIRIGEASNPGPVFPTIDDPEGGGWQSEEDVRLQSDDLEATDWEEVFFDPSARRGGGSVQAAGVDGQAQLPADVGFGNAQLDDWRRTEHEVSCTIRMASRSGGPSPMNACLMHLSGRRLLRPPSPEVPSWGCCSPQGRRASVITLTRCCGHSFASVRHLL